MSAYADGQRKSTAAVLKVLANENRLQILHWLSDPEAHFPPQVDGDLLTDGVCVGSITEKIGLRQPTVTSHMQALSGAGLVTGKKIKNWVFYKLNPKSFDAAVLAVSRVVTPPSNDKSRPPA